MNQNFSDIIGSKIKLILKDFTQNKELIGGIENNFHKFSINDGDYDEKRLIKFIFRAYLNFQIWNRPFEKTNWEIPFLYKGIPASISHQKFGFRIYIDKKLAENAASKIYQEINYKINICLKHIRPIIEQEGLTSLSKGEVIVENRLHILERQFKFFYMQTNTKRKFKLLKSASMHLLNKNLKRSEQAIFLENATYLSFFSLIEHMCLLSLAFTESKYKFSFEKYSQLVLQDKFKEVFPLSNPKYNQYYNQLINLAKFRRNPAAHGYLDKIHTIFHFYLPGAEHRIPMGLYSRELISNARKEENLSLLLDFLKFFKKDSLTKKIYWYLNTGLDIYYQSESFDEYEKYILMTDDSAKEHLKYLSRLSDDLGNMDW